MINRYLCKIRAPSHIKRVILTQSGLVYLLYSWEDIVHSAKVMNPWVGIMYSDKQFLPHLRSCKPYLKTFLQSFTWTLVQRLMLLKILLHLQIWHPQMGQVFSFSILDRYRHSYLVLERRIKPHPLFAFIRFKNSNSKWS